MYLFFGDDTNSEQSQGEFFIYGGIFFPANKLKVIDEEVKSIRTKTGYKKGDLLKFNTRERPRHITTENFNVAKEAVLDLCITNDIRFIGYLVLHSIAGKTERREDFAISSVVAAFHRFLGEEDDFGMVILDRFNEKKAFKMLGAKFQYGLFMQHRQENKSLPHIKAYSLGSIETSHAASVADIVLGAFRYAVNERANTDRASILMKKVAKLMWKSPPPAHSAKGRGFLLRPQDRNGLSQEKQNKYIALQTKLTNLTSRKTL